MEKLRNKPRNKNNPFDYRNQTGKNYKLKPKIKKIIIILTILFIILKYGKEGILKDTIKIKTYNIMEKEIDTITKTVNSKNTTIDFFMENKSPVKLIIKFNTDKGIIENDKYILERNIRKFISLRVYNITSNKIDVDYEVEII